MAMWVNNIKKFESVLDLEENKIYRYCSTGITKDIIIHDCYFKVLEIKNDDTCMVHVIKNCIKGSGILLGVNEWHLNGLLRYVSGPYDYNEVLAKIL